MVYFDQIGHVVGNNVDKVEQLGTFDISSSFTACYPRPSRTGITGCKRDKDRLADTGKSGDGVESIVDKLPQQSQWRVLTLPQKM